MSDPDSRERPFTALPEPDRDDAPVRETRARSWELSEAIGIFALLLIAAACGGLIAVYWPWNQGETAANTERLTALEMRVGQISAHAPGENGEASAETRKLLDTLKARLDADEKTLAALQIAGAPQLADTGPLKLSLDQIAARLAALEANAPPANLAQRLDGLASKSESTALADRLTRLEQRDPNAAMKRAASVLALADLQRAGDAGAPYAQELAALHTLLPDMTQFKQLAAGAQNGIPTEVILAASLSRQADRIIAAEREGRAKNWLERLWSHVEGLVSIRPVGNVKGGSTQAHIARAEVAMRSGELKQAVGEMSALDAPARAAAQGWIDSANARLHLESALRGLSNRVVAMLQTPLPDDTAPMTPPAATVPAK